MQSALIGIAFGLAAVGAAAVLGSVVAMVFAPKHFAMPSLMAELGTIEPKFDALVVAVLAGMGLAILALGMAPTALQLARRSIAALFQRRGDDDRRSLGAKTYSGRQPIVALQNVSFVHCRASWCSWLVHLSRARRRFESHRRWTGPIAARSIRWAGCHWSVALHGSGYRDECVGIIFQSYNLLRS